MDTEIKSRHTAFQHRLANEPTAQQRKRQERHIYIQYTGGRAVQRLIKRNINIHI